MLVILNLMISSESCTICVDGRQWLVPRLCEGIHVFTECGLRDEERSAKGPSRPNMKQMADTGAVVKPIDPLIPPSR